MFEYEVCVCVCIFSFQRISWEKYEGSWGNESDRIHHHSQRQQLSTTCIVCEALAASNRLSKTQRQPIATPSVAKQNHDRSGLGLGMGGGGGGGGERRESSNRDQPRMAAEGLYLGPRPNVPKEERQSFSVVSGRTGGPGRRPGREKTADGGEDKKGGTGSVGAKIGCPAHHVRQTLAAARSKKALAATGGGGKRRGEGGRQGGKGQGRRVCVHPPWPTMPFI